MPEIPLDIKDPAFQRKKTTYFSRLGLAARQSLKMHKDRGLWNRVDNKRDWGNVSEHCLVEVARASVLGDLLNLPTNTKHNLLLAAALHDFGKKDEKTISQQAESQWEGFEQAGHFSTRLMIERGFKPEVIRLVNSVGHPSLPEVNRILGQPSLSQEDIAFLCMHYIDDYTVNSDWATPARVLESGAIVNSLDARIDKNESTARYIPLNEEGRKHFAGKTTFQAQRELGNYAQQRISILLQERANLRVAPKDIPTFVDNEIKLRISSL